MPWFRVDDGFSDHPKVKSIPRKDRLSAIGLWAIAGAWSAGKLTDGFVPAYMIGDFGASERTSLALVDAGLWERVSGGYRFHSWDEWQPWTREQIEERRRVKAEAGRKGGLKSGETRRAGRSTGEADASHLLEPPTQPNQTKEQKPPQPSVGAPHATPPAMPPTRRPRTGTRISADWQPSDDLKAWTRATCPAAAHVREVDRFRDYWTATSGQRGRKLDWDATWRNWARKTQDDADGRARGSTTDKRVAQAQSLREKYAEIDAADGLATVTQLAIGDAS